MENDGKQGSEMELVGKASKDTRGLDQDGASEMKRRL